MLLKIIVCAVAIALGLYCSWWISSVAHYLYLEKADSFDELSSIVMTWFVIASILVCPALCWVSLKFLKRRFKD